MLWFTYWISLPRPSSNLSVLPPLQWLFLQWLFVHRHGPIMGQQIPCKESLNDHCFLLKFVIAENNEGQESILFPWGANKQLTHSESNNYTIFGEHQIHSVKLRTIGAGQVEEGYQMLFASMRAVSLFLRARALINFVMRATSTLEITNDEQRAHTW